MGTRADFYVKKGKKCEWLGSIAYDGYFTGTGKGQGYGAQFLEDPLTEKAFREKVTIMLKKLDHGTEPGIGWPWPWNNSRGTDYAYYWTPSKRGVQPWGNIVVSHFGEKCQYTFENGEFVYLNRDEEEGKPLPNTFFPDMRKIQRVTYGDRSGLIVIPIIK